MWLIFALRGCNIECDLWFGYDLDLISALWLAKNLRRGFVRTNTKKNLKKARGN